MNALDRLIPMPRLCEVDHVDLAAAPERVWELVRHGDLGRSPIVRALFTLRTLPDRFTHAERVEPFRLRIDDLVSTRDRPGFGVLVDDPPREVAIGAIGKVWMPGIPFEYVGSAGEFAVFDKVDFARVAWALRVEPLGEGGTRLSVEVRVDTTDEPSWAKFRAYFRFIGPASRFIRKITLASLARELGTPEGTEPTRALPGDDLLADASAQMTHFVDVAAKPSAVWPWLVQMGCHRAGYYSVDALDNGGVRSATGIDPALQNLRLGDVLPAAPDSSDGFEVLRLEPDHAMVLGGLFDPDRNAQLPFASSRPARYWQVTWAFALETLDETTTRLHVRARAAFSPDQTLHAHWIRPLHAFMESAQLRHLAARVEGRAARDGTHDVLAGVGGAAIMLAGFATPFMRRARSHWGLDEAAARREYPGDSAVPSPRWAWTHAVDIDADASEVWPWIAQIGADRGGFYSYQWLENVVGCDLRNAETVHPEWEVREGDGLRVHPKMPPLRVEAMERGRWFVAVGRADAEAERAGKSWVAMSWLFYVEPLGPGRTRFISRYRADTSDDLATRMSFGPAIIEPIGFAMDRRMLLGVKERVERAARAREPLRRISEPTASSRT